MAGLGLQGAFGVDAMQQSVRQRILDQLNEQARQQAQALAERSMSLKEREATANDELRREQLAALAEQRANASSDRRVGLATALGDQIPSGVEVQPTDPAVGLLQGGGRGSMLRGNMTLPSTQTSGAAPLPSTDENAPAPIAGMLRTIESPEALRSYTKLPSEKQNTDAAKNALEMAQAMKALNDTGPVTDANYMLNGKPIVAIRQKGRLLYHGEDVTDQVQPFSPPQHDPQNAFQLVPEVDPTTGKQTGRFTGYSTKTNAFVPTTGEAPGATKAAPGAQQESVWNAKRQDVVGKISQVDDAIDNAKDLIGPGAGRVATLEQMIGNPDPRIATLKTKLLALKDQVAGAMTMSNRQPSPTMLKRFDDLLGTQLTPESLHAATQALREMVGPSPSASSGTKPTAAELIKKYSGGD